MEYIGIIAGISGEAIVTEVKKLGYKTLIISGREKDSGMNISDKNLVIDLKLKEEIYQELRKNNVEKIILGTGHILAFQLASFLLDKGMKVSINPESSLIAKDKFLYKKILSSKGILTPKFLLINQGKEYDLEKIIEEIGLPCVIKSTIDTIYPKKANTKEEIIKYTKDVERTNSPVLIEEFIEGIDITIPVYSNYNEVKAVKISYYSKAKECNLIGFNFSENTIKLPNDIENRILKFSEEVIRKTNIIGMARLDIIVDKNMDCYVLECNSVMVTGVHPNQMEYGKEFLQKENINFAELTVKNALKIFSKEK